MHGLLWLSTARATVGLVVLGGVVVDAPPYARRWALHRRAHELPAHRSADAAWLPDPGGGVTADEEEALLRQAFPALQVIETVHHPAPPAGLLHSGSSMTTQTQQAEPDPVDWSDAEGAESQSAPSYPEAPDNPHNHRYTVSLDSRGPMIVVRGNTAAEINAAFQELEAAGTPRMLAGIHASMKAGSAPAPMAPPSMPQMPPQGFQAPQQQNFQQFPGQPGAAPAAWQNAGAPQGFQVPQVSEYVQAGWYRLDVPFKAKGAFDAVVKQYQLTKGRPSEGGQVSWSKDPKGWMCAPEVAGAFTQFNPMPA